MFIVMSEYPEYEERSSIGRAAVKKNIYSIIKCGYYSEIKNKKKLQHTKVKDSLFYFVDTLHNIAFKLYYSPPTHL